MACGVRTPVVKTSHMATIWPYGFVLWAQMVVLAALFTSVAVAYKLPVFVFLRDLPIMAVCGGASGFKARQKAKSMENLTHSNALIHKIAILFPQGPYDSILPLTGVCLELV